KLSDTHADLTGGTTSGGYAYKVYTQGIHLAGDVNGGGTTNGIALQNNVFNTDDVDPNYASDATNLSKAIVQHLFSWQFGDFCIIKASLSRKFCLL
ncbi:MAG: hypothetical protein ACPICC_05175, partial [Candidatus Puniceispirillaceae bacterium]